MCVWDGAEKPILTSSYSNEIEGLCPILLLMEIDEFVGLSCMSKLSLGYFLFLSLTQIKGFWS